MAEKKFFTLITGASQGIGKSIAKECASRGMNLFLVALQNQYLSDVEEEIKNNYNISLISFGIDLAHDDSPRKVYEFAIENGIHVNILINNVGFGTSGLFEKSDPDINIRMLKLNNQAFIGITYYFLKDLKKHTPSFILNMSSLEANLPLPYKAVYTGTKNFIYAFTLAFREELRNTGVSVSVLCPGPVVTNEDGMKRIQSQGPKAKLLVKMPDYIASLAIQKMFEKKTVIIPGLVPKIITLIGFIIPRPLKMKILEKVFRVYREHKSDPKILAS
jgi:short-subunit dehydrogenase